MWERKGGNNMANDIDMWRDIVQLDKIIMRTKDRQERKRFVQERKRVMKEFRALYIESGVKKL